MPAAAPPASRPDITALIPARNEARAIDACLAGVLGQDLAGRTLEVVVVMDRSADDTEARLAAWQARDARVRLLSLPSSLVSEKLNVGLRAARGRYVVRMDAHSEYAADYIRRSVELLEASGADAVGGIQVPLPGAPTPTGRAIAGLQDTWLGLGGGAHRKAGYEGEARTLWLGALRLETARRVGGFDEALFRSEDNDFYQRLRAAGGRLLVSASIRASYVCRPTLRTLAQQQFVTGREIAPTLRRNRRAFGGRHLVPGLAVVLGLALLSGAVLAPSWRTPLAVGLGLLGLVYLLLVVVNAAGVARRAGAATFVPAAVGTVIVHVAYGVGTLLGLPGALVAHRRGPRPDAGSMSPAESDASGRPSA